MGRRLGQAVRCAQALGLDRDISTSTCLGDEIRHRMWWELVDSDMYVFRVPTAILIFANAIGYFGQVSNNMLG